MRHVNASDMAEERKKKKGGEKEFVMLATNVSNNGRDINKAIHQKCRPPVPIFLFFAPQ
jgi:hypothetical protein